MSEGTETFDPEFGPGAEADLGGKGEGPVPKPEVEPTKPPPQIKLPDTTKIQLIALAQAGLAVAIAFGVPISQEQSVALVALAGVLGTVLITADAAIRRERARNADKLRPSAQISTTTPEGNTASVTMPMAENATPRDVADTFDELIKSFDMVTRFLEAEHAKHEAENGAKAKPRARRRTTPRR
jgi:hypothetical protein